LRLYERAQVRVRETALHPALSSQSERPDQVAWELALWLPCREWQGPGLWQGPNTNPVVLRLLQRAADEERIPYQLKAEGTSSPTDARMLQTSRGGVASGLLSVPLRYMHTPSEVLCLEDIQHTICAYILRLEPDIDFTPW
jgi:hypothetical protein